MNVEQTIERIEELTSKLAKLTYKLRGKNDRAGYLAAQAIEAARQWLVIAAEEDDAKDPFRLGGQLDDDEAA
jgi:hypothetical protein